MTPAEAKAYITWFRNNYLPKGVDYVQTSSGRQILLDSLNDEDSIFVAQQFEGMLDAALNTRSK